MQIRTRSRLLMFRCERQTTAEMVPNIPENPKSERILRLPSLVLNLTFRWKMSSPSWRRRRRILYRNLHDETRWNCRPFCIELWWLNAKGWMSAITKKNLGWINNERGSRVTLSLHKHVLRLIPGRRHFLMNVRVETLRSRHGDVSRLLQPFPAPHEIISLKINMRYCYGDICPVFNFYFFPESTIY